MLSKIKKEPYSQKELGGDDYEKSKYYTEYQNLLYIADSKITQSYSYNRENNKNFHSINTENKECLISAFSSNKIYCKTDIIDEKQNNMQKYLESQIKLIKIIDHTEIIKIIRIEEKEIKPNPSEIENISKNEIDLPSISRDQTNSITNNKCSIRSEFRQIPLDPTINEVNIMNGNELDDIAEN